MPSAINVKGVPKKNIRIIRNRPFSRKFSFIDKESKSSFKIELHVVSAKEQEQRRNPAYSYFSID